MKKLINAPDASAWLLVRSAAEALSKRTGGAVAVPAGTIQAGVIG